MYTLEKRGAWALLAAIAVAACIAGCGGGGNSGPGRNDSAPPTVTVKSYTAIVAATGGPVTINIEATDDVGVSKVEVKITTPSGPIATVTAAAQGGSQYKATYNAPANAGTTAKVYKFTAYAYDAAGNTGSDGEYTFQVPSAETPPAPPPFSIQ